MVVIQEIVASGFPWAASHMATTTSEEPACTGMAVAEFLGLADGGGKRKFKSLPHDFAFQQLFLSIKWCLS